MATTYRTKLFRSVIDCGCNMGLGEFADEAQFEDIEEWLKERGYGVLTQPDRAETAELAKQQVGNKSW